MIVFLPFMKNMLDSSADDAHANRRRPLRSYHLAWAVLALAVILDIALGYWLYQKKPSNQPDPPGVQTLAQPEAAPAFILMDQNLKAFTQTQLLGKWTIMLFGYTHCPDFCPTTLAALNNAYRRLERSDAGLAASTQVVFVSVDPFRDSAPVLADFVRHFNPLFIGATGPPAQLQRLTQPLGASYDYADPVSGGPLGSTLQQPLQKYSVNHSSGFYIFDAKARMVAWVLPPHTADRIVSVYKFIRGRYE